MKILYVIGSLDRGGAERHLSYILPSLKKLGYTPHIYTLGRKGSLAPYFTSQGIEVIHSPLASFLALQGVCGRLILLVLSALKLTWIMLRHRYSIVHCFLPKAYLMGGLCALVTKRPIRLMSRRSLNHYQLKHPVLKLLEFYLHKRMTAVLANSKAVYNDLLSERINVDKLHLLYNGIDLSEYGEITEKSLFRKKLKLDQDTLFFIIVANLFYYKGHEDLLQALALIKDKLQKPWQLLCVGRDVECLPYYKKLNEALGLEKHVVWLGERQDIPDYLHATDIGVICSHEEGFSNSVLEGMAAGLPMVVTQVGGNSEAIHSSALGRVVPPKSPKDLAAALLELAQDPKLRAEMGKAARQRVMECFSLERCIAGYHQLYQSLLNYYCPHIKLDASSINQ